MSWQLYLLSISSDVQFAIVVLGIICLVLSSIMWCMTLTGEIENIPRWMLVSTFTVGVLLLCGGVCIPTPYSISKAYAVTEGAKIVNAKNAQKLVDTIVGLNKDKE